MKKLKSLFELGEPDKGLLTEVLFQSCMFDVKMGNCGDPCAGPIAKPKR